jgi:hypothetical protein
MENKVFGKRPFSIITVEVCFACALLMTRFGVCSSWDEQELRLREDAAIRDANEAAKAEISKAKAIKRNRFFEEMGYFPDVNLISNDELAAIEKQRKGKVETIRTRFGNDINSLEQIQAAIPKEQTPVVRRKPPARVKPVALGTVTGIVFCNKRGAALVADEIVRENDTVEGIKVLRITPDYVEFKKQDKTWIQEVGQSPPAFAWEKPPPPEK